MSKLSSMTGYGEATLLVQDSGCAIRIQFKSVNSRYLDFAIRLPPIYAGLESEVQKKIKSLLKRGRVEVSTFRSIVTENGGAQINPEILKGFVSQLESLEINGLTKKEILQVSLPAILSRREVFEGSEVDALSDVEKGVFFEALDKSLQALIVSRSVEGESLLAEIKLQMSSLNQIVENVEKESAQAPTKIKEKFDLRLKELLSGSSISSERLEQEVAILADRIDIREELVRLKSHMTLFNNSILEGGRKLEFIVQEMGREVNTIGSKTNEASISTLVIEAKSILEKLREQIQNVE